MSQAKTPEPAEISLDELIAINDEIAALSRAGVPLEPALAAMAGDMPGRLGKMASVLAERCSRGESLADVIADKSVHLPPIYRAVVEAGIRSRRLPAAMESLAGAVRRLAETRRSIMIATIYPMLLLILSWLLFAFFTSVVAPAMLDGFNELGAGGTDQMRWLATLGQSSIYWGPALPLVVLLAAAVWWYCSRRASIVGGRSTGRLFGWVPWMKRMLDCSQNAAFAEILALLVQSDVPLHEALPLAADACGNDDIRRSAGRLAGQLHAGSPCEPSRDCCGLPPLLRWLMSGNRQRDVMLPALRHAAETYRLRALHQARLVQVFLPVVMTVVIGGTATLLFALLLWTPYASVLKSLAGA